MTTLAILGGLTGAVLGLRFTVLVLLPVITVGSGIVALIGLVHSTFGSALWDCILFGTAVQVGYLAGLFIRFTLAGLRASRARTSSRAAAPRST